MQTTFQFDPSKKVGIAKLQCIACTKALKLISYKKLVCSNNHNYALIGNVPILLSKQSQNAIQKNLATTTGKMMSEEYESSHKAYLKQFLKRLTNPPNVQMRIFDSTQYLNLLTGNENPDKFVVSIGGGPVRKRKTILNLNIEKFPNVDIVADAHNLPFKDNSVDGILIYAVFEHLERPDVAAQEIHRVLKKGGLVFAETPFLQHYHGYPTHFQNYTITGHEYLFRKLTILKSGPIAGPFDTVATFIMNIPEDFIDNKYLRKIIMYIIGFLLLPFRLLDVFFKNNPNTFKLTTGTYILAQKQ